MHLAGNVPVTRMADKKAGLDKATVRVRYVVKFNDIFHTLEDTIPVVGARVRMYFNTLTTTFIPGNDEEATVTGLSGDRARYEIGWDDPMWPLYIASKNKIRTASLGSGNGASLDTVINSGNFDGVLAGVHAVFYSYFYRDCPLTHGLKKPAKRLEIASINKDGRINTVPVRAAREIFFYGKKMNAGDDYQSEAAIKDMLHELGHISHNWLNGFHYSFVVRSKYGKPGATGMECTYMKSVFPESDYTYYL